MKKTISFTDNLFNSLQYSNIKLNEDGQSDKEGSVGMFFEYLKVQLEEIRPIDLTPIVIAVCMYVRNIDEVTARQTAETLATIIETNKHITYAQDNICILSSASTKYTMESLENETEELKSLKTQLTEYQSY